MSRPEVFCVCGCNGVGKSTYIKALFADKLPKVDPDLIKKEHNCSEIAAGKIALAQIDSFLAAKKTFVKESTLTSKFDFKTIEQAKALNYKIILYYLGVANPKLLIYRIKNRVALGGHHIDSDTVLRRYSKSSQNLIMAIHLCDHVFVFDNSFMYLQMVATFARGQLTKLNFCPEWFKPVLKSFHV